MPPCFAIRLPSLPLLRSLLLAAASALALSLLGLDAAAIAAAPPPLPEHLRDTGITAPGVVPFSPQYPLWSDGAEKRRWLWLPPGRFIDGSKPDAWQFPPGTRLWKEFAHDGHAVETRFIERLADGSWRYATYVWNADGSDALLAPAAGFAALPVASAPCSCRRTATRWPPTAARSKPVTSTCAASSSAAGCAGCRLRCWRSRRESRPRRR